MTSLSYQTESVCNPLDLVERVVMDRDWVFDRPADGELIAEVTGVWCNYRIWFNWQEDSGGLTLCCALDSKFPKHMLTKLHSLLALVNQKLWLGHFDVWSDDGTIIFRHAMPMIGRDEISIGEVQAMLAAALDAAERFQPAFHFCILAGMTAEDAAKAALFEVCGEA